MAPLAGRSVVIDPGHGGIDSDTYHSHGTPEKDINLQGLETEEPAGKERCKCCNDKEF